MKWAAALLAMAGAAEAETLECAPKFKVFCANAHVACAFASRIPTQSFRVSFGEGRGEVEFADGSRSEMRLGIHHSGRVLRAVAGPDWIRIDPENHFSHRIHHGRQALMSVGRCRAAD